MKPKTISYQKVFALAPYINEKIGIEMDLDDTDSPDEVFEECKRLVEKWGAKPLTDGETVEWETRPMLSSEMIAPPQVASVKYYGSSIPTIDPRAYETAEIGIDNATTIQDLEFYADIAVKYGLVEMYLNKKNALETMPFPK